MSRRRQTRRSAPAAHPGDRARAAVGAPAAAVNATESAVAEPSPAPSTSPDVLQAPARTADPLLHPFRVWPD